MKVMLVNGALIHYAGIAMPERKPAVFTNFVR